ncbi:hypothetical protein AAG906_010702 [Vitis piasezkii]
MGRGASLNATPTLPSPPQPPSCRYRYQEGLWHGTEDVAHKHREKVRGVVGLVSCTVGGTAIKEWSIEWARGQPLYENMVNRAKESVKSGWEIKALLWYQGESDTSSYNNAKSYKDNMESLIQNVHQDLAFSPNHPSSSNPLINSIISTSHDTQLVFMKICLVIGQDKFDVPGSKQGISFYAVI